MEYVLLTIIRLLIPLTILKRPIFGITASIFIDLHDFSLLNQQKVDLDFYSIWDKLLDIYYLSFAAFISLSFKDKIVKNLALFLFIFRLLGTILLIATSNRLFLFIFPNLFENFVLFYLFYVKLSKNQILFNTVRSFILFLVLLLIPKLVQEYFVNVLQVMPWTIWSIGSSELLNLTVWILIYLSLPLIGLIYSCSISPTLTSKGK